MHSSQRAARKQTEGACREMVKQLTANDGTARCSHGKLKNNCAECNPCPYGRLKRNCTLCNPSPRGKEKRKCADSSPCPHRRLKGSCTVCKPFPHCKLKKNCAKCTPCPHGRLKRGCAASKTARADQPSSKRIEPESSPKIKQEPEIKQEQFTIRGYFGFNDDREY